ncbi:MAG: ATP-binding cassette domain-containing protein [Actinomycetota bacterium]
MSTRSSDESPVQPSGNAQGASGVDVDAITVRFDDHTVLDTVSMSVAPGDVVALVGGSGSGKSTLLRVVAGLLVPDAGRVRIGGEDVTERPTHLRGVGMVFQDNQLFPHLDTADNVAFGLKMAGIGRAERRERAAAALAGVGLAGFERRRVTELSGGEAKRVALARTLIAAPRVVLLDEPLTGLDRDLHDELMCDLAVRLRSAETTAILVTHDHDEADAIADRTLPLASL